MSRAPYMPVATDALIADTTHLNAEEFGCYTLLLFAQWRNNGFSLPADDNKLARMARVTNRRWLSKIRPALEDFFEITTTGWNQLRIEKDFQTIARKVEINRLNGARGGRANALKNKETTPANATAIQNAKSLERNPTNHNHNHKKEAPPSTPQRGTRLPIDWEPSDKGVEYAAGQGLVGDERKTEVCKFRNYWCAIPGQRGVKLDWEATWRNWVLRWKKDAKPRKQSEDGWAVVAKEAVNG